jgi:hypothetical protein
MLGWEIHPSPHPAHCMFSDIVSSCNPVLIGCSFLTCTQASLAPVANLIQRESTESFGNLPSKFMLAIFLQKETKIQFWRDVFKLYFNLPSGDIERLIYDS